MIFPTSHNTICAVDSPARKRTLTAASNSQSCNYSGVPLVMALSAHTACPPTHVILSVLLLVCRSQSTPRPVPLLPPLPAAPSRCGASPGTSMSVPGISTGPALVTRSMRSWALRASQWKGGVPAVSSSYVKPPTMYTSDAVVSLVTTVTTRPLASLPARTSGTVHCTRAAPT